MLLARLLLTKRETRRDCTRLRERMDSSNWTVEERSAKNDSKWSHTSAFTVQRFSTASTTPDLARAPDRSGVEKTGTRNSIFRNSGLQIMISSGRKCIVSL